VLKFKYNDDDDDDDEDEDDDEGEKDPNEADDVKEMGDGDGAGPKDELRSGAVMSLCWFSDELAADPALPLTVLPCPCPAAAESPKVSFRNSFSKNAKRF
jgi:hypothetical protein